MRNVIPSRWLTDLGLALGLVCVLGVIAAVEPTASPELVSISPVGPVVSVVVPASPDSEAKPPILPAQGKPSNPVGGTQPRHSTPEGGTQPEPLGPLLVPRYNAQFLGSQGHGRRFCIIADNSGSMAGAKITDLKTQLLKTLTNLDRQGEFYIYCFNSTTEPMPHPGWLKGSAPDAEKVRTWVGAIRATGGTQPTPAFEAAFKLSPPPDVIFFMTDGLIPPNVPDRIVVLNTFSPKVVVNTIMFANPAPKGVFAPRKGPGGNREEDLLKRIAEQNGGTFNRYVPGG